jgi:feruloyl esterase
MLLTFFASKFLKRPAKEKPVPSFALAAGLAIFLYPVQAVDDFEKTCLSFTPEVHIINSTLQVLEYVSANTKIAFPYNDISCGKSSQVVSTALCRVALSISTSNKSSISFELWLPCIWTGRVLATGNGGIDGCVFIFCYTITGIRWFCKHIESHWSSPTGIKYEDMAYATLNGFSSYGANNGHNGTSGKAFYQNPEVVADFAWRSRVVLISFPSLRTVSIQLHNSVYFTSLWTLPHLLIDFIQVC